MYDRELDFMIIVLSFFSGIVIGVIFDIYRRIRKVLNPGNIGTALGDLIFWLIVTLFSFAIINTYLFGWVRGYFFIGLFTGFFIYIKTISRFIIKLLIILEKVFCFFALLPEIAVKKINGIRFIKRALKEIKNLRRIFKKIKK
mgnify:CR=1 FL=1